MPLIKFDNAHLFLDSKGVSRLQEYENNVIVDRIDFTEQENAGKLEWREDGVYLNIKGNYQRGFMFNKDYRISDYGNPRFHLVECSVIERFKEQGILSRYYFWSNSKAVTITQRGTRIEYENELLNLCSKCSEIIHQNHIEHIGSTNDFHNQLDLNDKKVENNENQETDIYDRPLNWRPISRAYKLEQNYTCEECNFGGNDFYSNYDKRHIHTHHIKSNELQNTHRNNLKALCILCHYNQDDHHKSNFEKPRIKKELLSFVQKYKERLIEIENKYVKIFLSEHRNELTE